MPLVLGSGNTLENTSERAAFNTSPGPTNITVNKSKDFSFEEFAKAANDYSMAGKIGQGGFGSV